MGHHDDRAPRRRYAVRPPRGRTLLGGVLLGVAFVVALLLVGVVGVPGVENGRPLGVWGTRGPAAVTGHQPGLTDALLAGVDLPPGYVAAPSLAPGPTAAATPTPAASPGAGSTGAGPGGRSDDRRLERGRRHLDCPDVFERPWEVAVTGGARPTDRVAAEHTTRRGALRQVLLRFTRDGAEAALGRFREVAEECDRFTARLDDGTRVTVRVREIGVSAGDEAYALLVTAAAERRAYSGFIAVGRTGPLLTVLRHIGPHGRVDADDAAAMLRRSLEKLRPLGRDRR